MRNKQSFSSNEQYAHHLKLFVAKITKFLKTPFSLNRISLFILQTIFSFITFVIFSFPYFFSKITPFSSLGLFSVVEEYPDHVFTYINTIEFIKGDKVQGNIVSNENNLGMVLIRFYNYGRINEDTVAFRIKDNDKKNWYYENTYTVDQFQPNEYFTFGFPVIENSKNKNYYFEIESLKGIHLSAIAISEKTPRIALIYQYSKGRLLKEKKIILTLLLKKINYAVQSIDKMDVLKAWVISFLALVILSKWKTLLIYIISTKAYTSFYPKYRFYVKKINFFFNAPKNNILYIHRRFFPFLHILIIIFTALIFRISYYINPSKFSKFFYTQMGSDGDYDQLMRNAIYYLKGIHDESFPVFWQGDWVINLRLFAIFFKIFGFVKGIDLFEYFLIILSILVSLGPFILLSKLKKFSLGGFMASLFLAVNPLSIKLALQTPLDTMTSFTFLLFLVLYVLSIEKKNYLFAIVLGILGFLDVLNHGLQMLNNLPALVLFAGYYIFIKSRFKRSIRFISIRKSDFFYAFLPLAIFLIIYFVWNYFYYWLLHSFYYFSPQALVSIWNPTHDPENILGTSVFNKVLTYFIKFNLVISSLQSYIGIPIFVFVGLFIFTLYFRFINILKNKWFIILSVISVVYVFLIFALQTLIIKYPYLFKGLNDNATYWFKH